MLLLYTLMSHTYMILVMDNASYHMGRGDDWKSPSKMVKAEAAVAMKKYGITSFTVKRKSKDGKSEEELTFAEETYTAKRGGGRIGKIPYVIEMKAELSRYFREHPEVVPNRTKELLDKEGWVVLYTPPMEPECSRSSCVRVR